MPMNAITVETVVNAPRANVWECFTAPEHITKWNHASDDWHTTRAENDLRVGGTFTWRMEAKDGSAGFDFTGTYTEVVPEAKIAYTMTDGRKVVTTFADEGEEGTRVRTDFDPESENTLQAQRSGWQAILDNFKQYCEAQK